MFGRLGFMEIVIILILVFVLFGAKKLPEIAKHLARGLREFKKEMSSKDVTDDDQTKEQEQENGGLESK